MKIDSNYLKRFRIFKPKTLFEPTALEIKQALEALKCPLCGRKLYQTRNGLLWLCKSKYNDNFKVTDKKLLTYSTRKKG